MKSLIVAALILFGCFSFNAHAQTYKINKQKYDYKMYMTQPGDPNNPAVMGLASFFIPGLGQMLSGETGRGLAFLGGSIALSGITVAGALMSYDEVTTYNQFGSFTEYETNPAGVAIMLTGLAATIALDVWAIVDAVRVAKVNNMYIQDLRGNLSSVKVELNPFIDTHNYLGQANTSAGLSLKVTF